MAPSEAVNVEHRASNGNANVKLRTQSHYRFSMGTTFKPTGPV